jgi:hypothetical protein
MRFISQYPNYGVQIRPQRVRPMGDGTSQVVQEPLYVKFTAIDDGGMLYEKEQYEAGKRLNFHGTQQEQDEATPVDLVHRLSVLDTSEDAERFGWSPEDVAEIERTLIGKTQSTPDAVMLMEEAPLTPPFPAYDGYDGTAEQLVLKLTEDGFELGEVLYYERSSFGPRRPDVIEALEQGIEMLKEFQVSA